MDHNKVKEYLDQLEVAGVCGKGKEIIVNLMKEIGYVPPIPIPPKKTFVTGCFYRWINPYTKARWSDLRIYQHGSLCHVDGKPVVEDANVLLEYLNDSKYEVISLDVETAMKHMAALVF